MMEDESKNKKASTVEKGNKRYEQKLRIMLEYMKKTGESIKKDTVYEGYSIGAWKYNLRQSYRNGVLNISDELLKKFIDSGIIIEGKERRDKTSQQEKYEFLMQMVGKTPEEIRNARMKNGFSVRAAKKFLQIEYNKGNCSLSNEQIENLIEAGILKPLVDRRIALIDKFGLPVNLAVKAEKIWESKDNLLKEYKTMDKSICEDSSKYEILEYLCTSDFFHAPNIISVSSESISELQKVRYWRFVTDVFNIKSSMRYFNSEEYLDIDEIKSSLSSLTDIEKKSLEYKYGLIDGRKYTIRDIHEKTNWSTSWVSQIIGNAMRKMRHPSRSNGIIKSTKDFDMLEQRCSDLRIDIENISNFIEEIINIRAYICENGEINNIDELDYKNLGISYKTLKHLKELNLNKYEKLPLEELHLSTRSFNLLTKNGIHTLGDLMDKSEFELAAFRGMGITCLNEIREKRAPYVKTKSLNKKESATISIKRCDEALKEYSEQKDSLKKELKQIQTKLKQERKEYSMAKEFYLTEEDCFNPDAIIPGIDRKPENTIAESSNNELCDDKMAKENEKEEVVDSEVISTEELERSKKLERAKALIQLNKEQDVEINELESQKKGPNFDE